MERRLSAQAFLLLTTLRIELDRLLLRLEDFIAQWESKHREKIILIQEECTLGPCLCVNNADETRFSVPQNVAKIYTCPIQLVLK